IEFDINKDVVYQKGKSEGKSEGLYEGEFKAKRAMIIEMLKDGSLSLQKIASYARVSIDEVVAIQQEISNNQ
ncbi:MAG: hypothetical protein ACLFOZ_09915, partial [Cyclobacteriaceae bacterium]